MTDRAAPRPRMRRIRDFLAARLDRGSSLGLGLTVGVAVCAALIWAFSGLLEEVLDAESLVRADKWTEEWFRLHSTPGGRQAFEIFTMFGSEAVWTIVPVVALLLWIGHRRGLLAPWLVANGGGWLVLRMLKTMIHRDRPQYAAEYLHGRTYSFPSGHAMGSTICYLALAYVLTSYTEWGRGARALVWSAAVAMTLLVGYSRLYLGVHYPSDVVGGFLAGGAWLLLCLTIARIVRGNRPWRDRHLPDPLGTRSASDVG